MTSYMYMDDATRSTNEIELYVDRKDHTYAWLRFSDGHGTCCLTLNRSQLAALVDQINKLDWSAVQSPEPPQE